MPQLPGGQLCAFAERGFIVVPGVVPPPLLDRALERIDRMIERDPPPTDHRGFHSYWQRELHDADALLACAPVRAAVLSSPS